MLEKLYRANLQHPQIPQEAFVARQVHASRLNYDSVHLKITLVCLTKWVLVPLSPKLCDGAFMASQLEHWLSQPLAFSLLNYPWLLSLEAKALMLHAEARKRKAVAMTIQSLGIADLQLTLKVRRDNLIEDSLSHIRPLPPGGHLTWPLKVIFEGEAGIDEGGIRREYFQLLGYKLYSALVYAPIDDDSAG